MKEGELRRGGEMSSCLQASERMQCILFNYKTLDRMNYRTMRGRKQNLSSQVMAGQTRGKSKDARLKNTTMY